MELNNTEFKNSKKYTNNRDFEEVEGGEYLENGFYVTPNGSFWDSDGVYFNKEGYDRHEGYYDKEYEYHPGRGWVPHALCYEDELENSENYDYDNYENELNKEDEELDYDNIDDLHEDINYDELANNKEKQSCIINKDILTFKNKSNN